MSWRLDDKPHIDFDRKTNTLTVQTFNSRDSIERKLDEDDAMEFLEENGISGFTAEQIVKDNYTWELDDEKAKDLIGKLLKFRQTDKTRKLF